MPHPEQPTDLPEGYTDRLLRRVAINVPSMCNLKSDNELLTEINDRLKRLEERLDSEPTVELLEVKVDQYFSDAHRDAMYYLVFYLGLESPEAKILLNKIDETPSVLAAMASEGSYHRSRCMEGLAKLIDLEP
jgi:hypothetical protein